MEFNIMGDRFKKIKENIFKKIDKFINSHFFVRMQPEEGPTKFYPHYYGYIRPKVKAQSSYGAASNDHLHI